MTLETIKLNQEQLNKNLLDVLDILAGTVTSITGHFLEVQVQKEGCVINGLITEICEEQEKNLALLESLNKISQRLFYFTYGSSESINPCSNKN
jgi:hypothetical protein